MPCSLDGKALDPVTLIERAEAIGARFGVGRGIHLGDTIIGIKGRVAFEAPAAELLLTAHRELEKLVLSARQQRMKDTLAAPYGDLVHEGQQLDPVCRDIEAFLVSSQPRVTGEVNVLLRPGCLFVEGVTSPYSLMEASKGAYGESAGEWTAAEAHGILEDAGAARHFLHARRTAAGSGLMASQMRTVVVDKIASIAQACGLSHEIRVATSDIPLRGRRGTGGRDPEQQIDLQPARADQRPHGQGVARRRDRRRARPPAGAVRLLGPHPRDGRRPATSCRC